MAEFQKILDIVLGPEVLQHTVVYVDDIHIASKSFSEHMMHLTQIFERFRQFNVTINKSKSEFLRRQISFLGHIITAQVITMDPEQIKTIQNFAPTRNKKQVQSFLGFINFYRKYIRNLSQLTGIISKLTKKEQKWEWTEAQQSAFEKIKQTFLEDIIIQYPDFNKPFYLATDASTTHVGAGLYQLNELGLHRSLGFASRVLNPAESRYCTTEIELLAVVFACKKIPYVYPRI